MTKSSKAKSKPAPKQGYAGHRPGSRKGTIHQLWVEHGQDTAWVRGLKMKLSPRTLRNWFVVWRRDADKVNDQGKPKRKGTPKGGAALKANVPESPGALPQPEAVLT